MILALPMTAASGKPACEGLGRGDQVRLDAIMFHGEEFSGAAKAGLDFVGDQQDAMLVAKLAQAHHQFLGRNVEATFALHRAQ